MKSLIFSATLLTAAPLFAQAEEAKPAAEQKPNIIIIMADDMGWGDSAPYGHPKIKSPALDRLAKEGMLFTQCYSASGVCSPSRSSILTGRTPYRNGVFRHLSGNHVPHLRDEEITYPELLKEVGYQNCHVGKWHLLSKPQFNNPDFPQINNQGFDYWFATHNNADPSHKNPNNFYRNGEKVGVLEGFSAPLVADEAISWLETKRDKSKPFTMSVWFHEPHKPIATDVKFSELYPDESAKHKRYFGNISQLDFAVGKILDTLDEQKLTDNTLVIFTSDNGPLVSEGGSVNELRGLKRSDFEGGIRVPGIIRWPNKVKAGSKTDTPIIGTDIFTTILDINNIPVPTDRTIDGVSILPVFEGKPLERKIPLFWRTHVSQAECRVALRKDNWKIVGNDTLTKFMLFDIPNDHSEKNDLFTTKPEIAKEMQELLIKTWTDIKEEGPNEWWETEKNGKMHKGATYSY